MAIYQEYTISPDKPPPEMVRVKEPFVVHVMTILFQLFLPALIYTLLAMTWYETINETFINGKLHLFLAAFFLLIGTYMWKTRDFFNIIFFFAAFMSMFGIYFGTICMANGAFDTSSPRTVEAVVIEKKELRGHKGSDDSYVVFSHWDHPELKLQYHVSRHELPTVELNKTRIRARVKKGALGYEWYVRHSFQLVR